MRMCATGLTGRVSMRENRQSAHRPIQGSCWHRGGVASLHSRFFPNRAVQHSCPRLGPGRLGNNMPQPFTATDDWHVDFSPTLLVAWRGHTG
jgi:hypothetical protein